MVDAILKATSRVLVADGYDAMTTTRVAKMAGVSIGSLYQYFPNKEALVAALIDDHIGKILTILGEAVMTLQDAPMDRAVRSLVRSLLLAHAVDPELHAVLTQSFSRVQGFERVGALNQHARALLSAYLGQRQATIRPKNIELASMILVHSIQAVLSAAVVEPDLRVDDEELIDELATLVLHYLRVS
jgi:AcrR family transcriptional regulator